MRAPEEIDVSPLDELIVNEYLADPYPVYERLRAEAPVHWCEPWHSWFITRYDDVAAVLRDDQRFTIEHRFDAFLRDLPEAARAPALAQENAVRSIQNSDPPEHTRLRSCAVRQFTPAAVVRYRAALQEYVGDVVEALPRSEPFDFVAEVARKVPAFTICMVMGAPAEDIPLYHEWTQMMMTFWSTTPPTPTSASRLYRGPVQDAYFARVVDNYPTPDDGSVLGGLIEGQRRGTISHDELVSYCESLLLAGMETVQRSTSNALATLLSRNGLYGRLVEERALIPSGLDELLRFEPPLQRVPRLARVDLELGGMTLRGGDMVFAMVGSANRDPERFVDPDEIDLERRPNEHLGFGWGRHLCIGAALARLEGEVIFEQLVATFRSLELVEPPCFVPNPLFRGLDRLIVVGT